MNADKFIKEYEQLSKKNRTKEFNCFSVRQRKLILKTLPPHERKKFIKDIREQAVKDFWTHEQALIKEGKCTRDWSPEQIEDILNISEKTGVMSINCEAAVDF